MLILYGAVQLGCTCSHLHHNLHELGSFGGVVERTPGSTYNEAEEDILKGYWTREQTSHWNKVETLEQCYSG